MHLKVQCFRCVNAQDILFLFYSSLLFHCHAAFCSNHLRSQLLHFDLTLAFRVTRFAVHILKVMVLGFLQGSLGD